MPGSLEGSSINSKTQDKLRRYKIHFSFSNLNQKKVFELSLENASAYPLPAKFFTRAIRAFARVGMTDKALEIFFQMPKKYSVVPDLDTTNTALMIYFTIGEIDQAWKIWNEVCLYHLPYFLCFMLFCLFLCFWSF